MIAAWACCEVVWPFHTQALEVECTVLRDLVIVSQGFSFLARVLYVLLVEIDEVVLASTEGKSQLRAPRQKQRQTLGPSLLILGTNSISMQQRCSRRNLWPVLSFNVLAIRYSLKTNSTYSEFGIQLGVGLFNSSDMTSSIPPISSSLITSASMQASFEACQLCKP